MVFKYRQFVVVFSLLLVLLLLSSCAQTKVPTIKAKESLTLLHYFSGEFSGGIDALVGGFNQEQDDYVLNAIPIDHEAFKTSIIKALKDNNPPELYSYWAGLRTKAIADQLEPLDEIWKTEELDAVFSKSIVEDACKIDGKYYLLPITQHYVAFFYNKEVFDRLNLEVPKDWAAFMNVCEVLKQDGVTPIGLGSKSQWPAQFWFDYLLLRSYPIEVREALMEGSLDYSSPEIISVFEQWKQLIDSNYFSEDPNSQEWHQWPLEGLSKGEVGMTLMGTWAISTLESEYSMVADRDFGYFDFPVINKEVPFVALGPVDGIIVPKNSVNAKGAMSAIAFLARPESQKAMAIGSGALSPSLQVDTKIYGPLQLKILPSIQKASAWAFNYDLATSPDAAKLGLQLFSDFLVFPKSYRELLKHMDSKLKENL